MKAIKITALCVIGACLSFSAYFIVGPSWFAMIATVLAAVAGINVLFDVLIGGVLD